MAKVKTIGLPIKQTEQDRQLMADLNACKEAGGHRTITATLRGLITAEARRIKRRAS